MTVKTKIRYFQKVANATTVSLFSQSVLQIFPVLGNYGLSSYTYSIFVFVNIRYHFIWVNTWEQDCLVLCSKCMFNFMINCQTLFQSGRFNLHFHQQYMRTLVTAHPCQHLILSVFLNLRHSKINSQGVVFNLFLHMDVQLFHYHLLKRLPFFY